MSFLVFAALLSAAFRHASWHAIVKAGGDKMLTAVMVTTAAAGLSAVARTYQVADMSQAYPLMRGTAPLIVALASVFLWTWCKTIRRYGR